MHSSAFRPWIARILVTTVFIMNVQSSLAFIVRPGAHTSGFELSGTVGLYLVQAIGILFLIWNATYPPVIFKPAKYRVLFGVVVVQQVIGLAGESWLLSNLDPGHETLAATAARFVFFDTLGLIALAAAFLLTREGSRS
ncbi:MAG: hypothetical protein A2Z37_05480 [Chloroflexi bacterium RBG_19FT_COMBO_62_14]|nr:MAG: hypothetical protein A2Z37_05480 [Chloroflexi bacterium RBG_19FT_COMBO_62_14]